jgi:hypothetical protein
MDRLLTEAEFRRDPVLSDEFERDYLVYKSYFENKHCVKMSGRSEAAEECRNSRFHRLTPGGYGR